jgi:segregation and condensation protein B
MPLLRRWKCGRDPWKRPPDMDSQLRKIADRLRVEMDGADLDRSQKLAARALRIAEAVIFAASEPVKTEMIASQLPVGSPPIEDVLASLSALYRDRGVNLVKSGEAWSFRTAQDLAFLVLRERIEPRKLSRAALETLAIIAYHQPVTRAEIEDIRGVAISRGMLDILLEIGWVEMRGRRRTPGKPVTYGTTLEFLSHFNLAAISDLPGIEELKAAGIIDPAAASAGALELPMLEEEIALGEDLFDVMAEERLLEDEPALDPEAKA